MKGTAFVVLRWFREERWDFQTTRTRLREGGGGKERRRESGLREAGQHDRFERNQSLIKTVIQLTRLIVLADHRYRPPSYRSGYPCSNPESVTAWLITSKSISRPPVPHTSLARVVWKCSSRGKGRRAERFLARMAFKIWAEKLLQDRAKVHVGIRVARCEGDMEAWW
ncbi:hypothetical protein KC358_g7 [Hortaea werneckii]|nr:hypothetical protein KC358_g7 [Hortaea werneckii]